MAREQAGFFLGYDDSIEGTIDEEAKFRAVDLSEFASTLLTRIIPKMLGGKGEIIQEPDAFIYRLTCPLDALTDVSEGEGLAEGAMEEELLAGFEPTVSDLLDHGECWLRILKARLGNRISGFRGSGCSALGKSAHSG